MNALRQRLADAFPNKEPGVSTLILDGIANVPPRLRTQMMDKMAVSFLASGISDPFDQRTREQILEGGLDEDESPTD